jgi:hypothetical protein
MPTFCTALVAASINHSQDIRLRDVSKKQRGWLANRVRRGQFSYHEVSCRVLENTCRRLLQGGVLSLLSMTKEFSTGSKDLHHTRFY